MGKTPTFLELVELHERKWGVTQYPGRPTLTALMTSSIVAVWTVDKRFIISAHAQQGELDQLITDILTGKVDDGRKLATVFVNQEPAQFRAAMTYQKSAPPQEATKPASGIMRTKPIRKVAGRAAPPMLVVKKGPTRHLYECPDCGAIQDSVSIVGSPRCPACGHEMRKKA